MKYGLEERVVQQIIAVLSSFSAIDKAILYGSRAKGNYKSGSDIDLCLSGSAIDQSYLQQIDLALDDLLLPYTFDLSSYERLTNRDLIAHIDRCGVVFFQRPNSSSRRS
jgi:predicted nucleotidyltransferase